METSSAAITASLHRWSFEIASGMEYLTSKSVLSPPFKLFKNPYFVAFIEMVLN